MEKKFAETLKKIRKEKNMSQEDLAAYVGLERQTISAYENGIREPSLDVIIRMANLFDVSLDTIVCSKDMDKMENTKALTKPTKEDCVMQCKEACKLFDVKGIEETDGLIIGKDNTDSIVSIPKDNTWLSDSVLVFGQARSGKSRSYALNRIGQIVKNGESAIITDSKGELYNASAKLFKDNGYIIRVFNITDPLHSDSWNFLAEVAAAPCIRYEIVELIAEAIITNSKMENNDTLFNMCACKNLLSALCIFVCLDGQKLPLERNIECVIELLEEYDDKRLNCMFQRLPSKHPAVAYWRNYASMSDELRPQIRMLLVDKLNIFKDSWTSKITAHSDIDTLLPAKSKCAYFVIAPQFQVSQSKFVSLFLNISLLNVYNYACLNTDPLGKCDVPVNFIFDDFQNIDRLQFLPWVLNVFGGKDIRVSMIMQSIASFKRAYPEEWEKIIHICSMVIDYGCDMETSYVLEGLYGGSIPSGLRNDKAVVVKCGKKKPLVLKKLYVDDNPIFKDDITYDLKNYVCVREQC